MLTNNNPATGTFFRPTGAVTDDEIRVEFNTVQGARPPSPPPPTFPVLTGQVSSLSSY